MHDIISKFFKVIRSLTWLDALVLIAVTLVIATFLVLRFSKKQEWVSIRLIVANDEWWWEAQAPNYWQIDGLTEGMVAKNSFGNPVARIVGVNVFDIGGYRRRAYVDIDLKAEYDKKRDIFLYNFQPLQIGKPLDLTFGKYNVHGLVTYIGSDKVAYNTKKIEVKLYGVRPEVAEQYKPGLSMRDTAGQELAAIDKVTVEPHIIYEFSDLRGRSMPSDDLNLRDVVLELTVKSFHSGDNDFFVDRAALKVGEFVWFQFPYISVRESLITKIIE